MKFKITSLTQRNKIIREAFTEYKINLKLAYKKHKKEVDKIEKTYENIKQNTQNEYEKFIDKFGKFKEIPE